MKLIICILGLTAMALAADLQNRNDLQKLLKDSNDKFSAQMFHEVVTDKENVGKSVILSAFSVLPPLGQLALASEGESHDELLRAISLPNDATVEEVFKNFNEELRSVKGVELRTANRIYVALDAKLNQNFSAISKEVFDSTVQNIDFLKQAETVKEINAWVESQTNNRIKDLLSTDSVDSSTRAVLVNAIYFKGSWKYTFNKNLTRNKDFHVSKGQTVKVPTMAISAEFQYGESAELDAKLLKMPYDGPDTSFLIVLPNQVDGLAGLQEKLKTASLLNNAESHMYQSTVDLELPKFKIETTTNLKEVLQRMNVKKLFNAQEAKLNKLLEKENDLFISDAVQKAFIEVTEEGAEAAAANAFFISRSARVLPPRKNVLVDHPFYFELKHKSNILFSGTYVS